MDNASTVQIVCVPTDAGTHFAGQSKAPEALLEQAHLKEKLENVGFRVLVDNALKNTIHSKTAAWQPSLKHNGARNERATIEVMRAVRGYFNRDKHSKQGVFTLVIGGDCSITPAVLAGLHSWHPPGTRIGLLYFDGDADLSLPLGDNHPDSNSGVLDSMVLTHLAGRAGGLESMKEFGRPDGSPLVTNDNMVLFGFDPLQPITEHWTYLLEHGFKAFTRPTVQRDPVKYAAQALAWLADRVDVVYLHFDVDVIDSGTFPLGNFPHYAGLDFENAFAALRCFLDSPRVQGIVITEINPNNDPDGTMINKVVENIAEGLEKRPRK